MGIFGKKKKIEQPIAEEQAMEEETPVIGPKPKAAEKKAVEKQPANVEMTAEQKVAIEELKEKIKYLNENYAIYGADTPIVTIEVTKLNILFGIFCEINALREELRETTSE